MKSIIRAALILALGAATAPTASALVFYGYNPATGGVFIDNGETAPLWALQLTSPYDALTGVPLSLPGTLLDDGDLPVELTYLDFPTGQHFIGDVVTPGTSYFGFSVLYYPTPQTGPIQAIPLLDPEPTGLTLASFGLLGVARLRGAKRREKR